MHRTLTFLGFGAAALLLAGLATRDASRETRALTAAEAKSALVELFKHPPDPVLGEFLEQLEKCKAEAGDAPQIVNFGAARCDLAAREFSILIDSPAVFIACSGHFRPTEAGQWEAVSEDCSRACAMP